MFESKYSKVLTVILVIVIVAIIGLLGFLAYDYYQNYVISNDAKNFVENFEGEVTASEENKNETTNNEVAENTTTENPLESIENTSSSGSASKDKPTYKGFGVLGTITIPAINLEYPILDKVTPTSIETAVAFLYGTGINQPGNSVIIGHNYRNGLFF